MATIDGVQLRTSTRPEEIFPKLTAAQMARVAAHGRVRPVVAGEVLVEAGADVMPFFVVSAGALEIVRPTDAGERLIVRQGPGEFTGEVNMLTGRRTLV